jgi:thioredoxin reductase
MMADFKVTPLDAELDFSNLPYWDVVIVGAGPAGLAAGLTTAHRGLTTLIVEAKSKPGGQPEFLYADKVIVDIPGFPDGITGQDLSSRVYRQAVDALVQFRFNEELVTIEDTDQEENGDPLKRVVTSNGGYLCRKVIIAFGLLHYPRKLSILDRLDSSLVHYKMPKVKDYASQRVLLVGGGDSALDAAVMALQRNADVDVLVREDTPVGKADTVERIAKLGGRVRTNCEVAEAVLDDTTEDGQLKIVLNDRSELTVAHAIIQIGFLSAKDTFEKLKLRLNEDGSIAIDPYFETSRRGIFAVGDVHGDIKLITVAWAEGIQAAIHAFKEITSPYWLNEKRLRDHKITLIGEKIVEAARRGRGT